MTNVFADFGWSVTVYIVSFGSIFGLFSCLMGAMFRKFQKKNSNNIVKILQFFGFHSLPALPRVLLAMSSDGLLFSVFSNVHPTFKTPTWGILISGVLTGALSAIFDVNQLVNMISIGTVSNHSGCVFLLGIICKTCGRLRKK